MNYLLISFPPVHSDLYQGIATVYQRELTRSCEIIEFLEILIDISIKGIYTFACQDMTFK